MLIYIISIFFLLGRCGHVIPNYWLLSSNGQRIVKRRIIAVNWRLMLVDMALIGVVIVASDDCGQQVDSVVPSAHWEMVCAWMYPVALSRLGEKKQLVQYLLVQ